MTSDSGLGKVLSLCPPRKQAGREVDSPLLAKSLLERVKSWAWGQDEVPDRSPILIKLRLQLHLVSSERLWILTWDMPVFMSGTKRKTFNLFIFETTQASASFPIVKTSELTIIQSNYCSLTVKVPCSSFHKYPAGSWANSVQSFLLAPFLLICYIYSIQMKEREPAFVPLLTWYMSEF